MPLPCLESDSAKHGTHPSDPSGDLYHLAWGMLPANDELDGYLAGFYLDWAERLGLSEEETIAIIRQVVRI